MHDVLRFWLDRGVDGFRMDVIHCIGKDPALPDDPPELAALAHVPLNDRPETHELLRGIRGVLDEYPGDRMSVGEVYLLDTARVATYYGDGDELHLAFNFPPLFTPLGRGQVAPPDRRSSSASIDPVGAWPTWVLSNHDSRRHRTRYGSEARARAAAVLLLDAAGHAVPLRRRGARPRGRRRPARPGRRSRAAATAAGRRSRGTPAPAHGWADGRSVAAVAARRRPAATSQPSGPTRRRSCTSTGGCSPPGGRRPALRAGDLDLLDGCPTACSAYERAPTATTAASC